jgi:hypothetical protein
VAVFGAGVATPGVPAAVFEFDAGDAAVGDGVWFPAGAVTADSPAGVAVASGVGEGAATEGLAAAPGLGLAAGAAWLPAARARSWSL